MNIPNDEGTAPSEEEVRQILHDFEARGLVRRTGEIRHGRPVFVLTELGRVMNPNGPLSEQ